MWLFSAWLHMQILHFKGVISLKWTYVNVGIFGMALHVWIAF
jgi:hypothetical protein